MVIPNMLISCPLFDGISAENLPDMLTCLGARMMTARKGQFILQEGTPAKDIGVLLSGQAHVIRTDYFGTRSIMLSVAPGQLFAESFACARAQTLPVSVIAREDSSFMLIDCRRIMTTCSSACAFHSRIIYNLVQIVADKNLIMHRKALVTSKRTTREKLMAYLLMQAKEAGCADFSVPFDRQGLADYLEVDRTGLSAEMSKLKREGVIDYYKSDFRLLKLPVQHD